MHTRISAPTLAHVMWFDQLAKPLWLGVFVVLGSLALAVSAKVQIPFWPVPMTMQTFVVLVMGMAFGWKLTGFTLTLYLAQGLVGLPVFAGGAGAAYLMGPTGGYLIGFLAGGMAMGLLADRGWGRTAVSTLGAMLIGTCIIFALGVSWLGSIIGFEKAVAAGLMPFVFSELCKIALATVTMPFAWKLVAKSKE